MSRRRLFFDIEKSFYVIPVFQLNRKQYIPPTNILRWSKVICIAWKWAGKKKVHCLQWDKDQDDREMLIEFVKVMESADEIIAHNGDGYDVKHIRTRCLFHRIPMPPKFTSIDTLKKCRARFAMHSNKLDEVAKFLGLSGKMETGGMPFWVEVVEERSEKALKKMVRYCKRDVTLLEEVFDVLNPYILPSSRMSSDIARCPECGELSLRANKRRQYTPAGSVRITLKCANNACPKLYAGTVPALKWDARMGE